MIVVVGIERNIALLQTSIIGYNTETEEHTHIRLKDKDLWAAVSEYSDKHVPYARVSPEPEG